MRQPIAFAFGSLLGLAFAAPPPAGAGWKLETKKDAMTDRVEKIASVRSTQGHELRVYADHRDEFLAEIRIPESSPEAAVPALILRVDDLSPVVLPAETFHARRIVIRLGNPDEKEQGLEPDRQLQGGVGRQMMDGSRLVVRTIAKDETEHDALFDLAGARAAIAGALGVPSTLTDEQKLDGLWREFATNAGRRVLERCERAPDPALCELDHAGCKDRHRGDAKALHDCFELIGK